MAITGYKTAMVRKTASAPLRWLLDNHPLIIGNVLDYGCGRGADVEFLKANGKEVTGYDPHWQPTLPEGKFQTVLCTFVLNVITEEEQKELLVRLGQLVANDGDIFIAVRRDIPKEGAKGRDCVQRYVECPDGYHYIYKNSSFAIFMKYRSQEVL
jgi:hypothetical protein